MWQHRRPGVKTACYAGIMLLAGWFPCLRADAGPKRWTGEVDMLAPGCWEVVVGVSHARGGGAHTRAAPELEIGLGVAANWQVEIEIERERLRPAGGKVARELEGALSVKWLAHSNPGASWAAAVAPEMRFDTAPGLSLPAAPIVEERACRLPLLFEKTLGVLKFGAEAGRIWRSKHEDRWSAGLAVECEFGEDFGLGAELYSLWSPSFSRRQVAAGLGAAVEMSRGWQFLATIGCDLHSDFGPRATARTFVGVRCTRIAPGVRP